MDFSRVAKTGPKGDMCLWKAMSEMDSENRVQAKWQKLALNERVPLAVGVLVQAADGDVHQRNHAHRRGHRRWHQCRGGCDAPHSDLLEVTWLVGGGQSDIHGSGEAAYQIDR